MIYFAEIIANKNIFFMIYFTEIMTDIATGERNLMSAIKKSLLISEFF